MPSRRPLAAGLGLSLVAGLGLALVAIEARADLLPEGYKGVKLSIKVDAEVPTGKSLVLANTFRGADLLEAGKVSEVEWHPLGGDMRLYLLAADAAAKIGPLREGLERDPIKAIVAAGIGCGDAFPGVRVIPESSPAVEVRWTYRVSVDGDACKAEQVSMAYLDAGGASVVGPNGEPAVDEAPTPAPATPAGG
ncbi:MAG: hypothetical protein H6711_25450 [Myxococcales bacterium]|nr:hypothetical protein [Myxococcales bacterium]